MKCLLKKLNEIHSHSWKLRYDPYWKIDFYLYANTTHKWRTISTIDIDNISKNIQI